MPSPTSEKVDIVVSNNATFNDSFWFDPPYPWGVTGATGPTGTNWTLTGQNFRLDIKGNKYTQVNPLLSLFSTNGQIVVDDVNQRILHFNVPEATLTAALIPGEYEYDFIMYSNDNPPVRVQLMHGKFRVDEGITGG
jgi:hypothetical protein